MEDLGRSVACISPDGDIIAIANSKGKEGKPHDQLLYDSFVSIQLNEVHGVLHPTYFDGFSWDLGKRILG